MKILFVIFSNQLASSFVTNLFNTIDRLGIAGHEVVPIFVDRNMDFFALNKFFKGETSVPMDGKIAYDKIIFSDMNVMPDARYFAEIVENDYNVFTFDVTGNDGAIPVPKTTDEVPMFCWGIKYGVLESLEFPWFKPSVASITDGIMGSFKDDVIVLPYQMVRWA